MRTFVQKPKAKSSIPIRAHRRESRAVHSIFHLQRTMGNQAVQRLLAAHTRDAQEDSTTQPTLAIEQVDDPLEQEADHIADEVMRMKGAQSPREECGNERPEELQRNASGIGAFYGGGAPLPRASRAFFESTFGHDFAAVRIHADSRAARLARSVNARAFTLGRDIVFGAGEYSIATGEGTRLLAHELAHVVQQQGSQGPIQRQPKKPKQGGGSIPYPFTDVYDQIDIIMESQLPLEFYKKPEIRHLTFSERETMVFQRKLAAIVKLGDLRDGLAVATLVAVLEDRVFAMKDIDPLRKRMLRQHAVDALGKIGDTAALTKLNDLLNSKDPEERKLAAGGFSGAAGGQAATDLLNALKKETDASIKAQIIYALGEVGSGLSSSQEKELIVKELIPEMEKSTGAIKGAAIRALGKLKVTTATEALLKQLKLWHSIEALAQDIIGALGEIGDSRAVDYLVIMLGKHGATFVRHEAAIALGRIRGAKALAALRRRLSQEPEDIVKQAILKAIGPPQVLRWTFRGAPL